MVHNYWSREGKDKLPCTTIENTVRASPLVQGVTQHLLGNHKGRALYL